MKVFLLAALAFLFCESNVHSSQLPPGFGGAGEQAFDGRGQGVSNSLVPANAVPDESLFVMGGRSPGFPPIDLFSDHLTRQQICAKDLFDPKKLFFKEPLTPGLYDTQSLEGALINALRFNDFSSVFKLANEITYHETGLFIMPSTTVKSVEIFDQCLEFMFRCAFTKVLSGLEGNDLTYLVSAYLYGFSYFNLNHPLHSERLGLAEAPMMKQEGSTMTISYVGEEASVYQIMEDNTKTLGRFSIRMSVVNQSIKDKTPVFHEYYRDFSEMSIAVINLGW